MEEFLTAHFWFAVGQIIMIDILLGGDNAVVIALACRQLPDHQRTKGIMWGTAGAIVTLGAGAFVGASSATSIAGAAPKLGGMPQTTLRSRFTRGYQDVRPPDDMRMKTQPRLSTYCAPLKPDGGSSAGSPICAIVCACAAKEPNTAAIIAALTNPETITTPK